MTTTTHSKSYVQPQENWRQQYDAVTHNDVIDAYLKGKQAGKDEAKIAMVKLFEQNLLKAQENTEKLHEQLTHMGFTIASIHLKADTLTHFMALIISSYEDYINEKFLEAISAGRKMKNEIDSDDFSINFYFTYQADTLKEHCLDSDGYFLKYDVHK